jgi:hypothetical protein
MMKPRHTGGAFLLYNERLVVSKKKIVAAAM